MQGITVALSPKGIQYFVQMLTASGGSVNAVLSGIKPADRSIPISDFDYIHNQGYDKASYTSITVRLSNGNVSGFNSVLQSFQQQVAGAFQIVLSAGAFNANYSWEEDFTEQDFHPTKGGTWAHCSPNNNPTPYKNTYGYAAGISSLGITANFSFAYSASYNTYTLPLTSITATAGSAAANIPGSSIIQDQVNGLCVQSHVDGATVDSIDDIDFKSALQSAFGGYLASIPASGQLFQDPTKGTITFAFGVGDSQLAFPNDQGLTVGVTGISTYTLPGQSQPQQYPGTPPSNLPVPAVPTDGHHLQMYVSDYTINGLYWAFALGGQLTSTVTPADIQNAGGDPSVLYVATYYNPNISNALNDALAPYANAEDNMYAMVSPQEPPTVAFQTVYTFNSTTMAALKNVLSKLTGGSQVYDTLSEKTISSQTFTNTTALEHSLNNIKIDPSFFATIESTIQELAAVVTHNLQFTLTIQDTLPNGDAPYLTFTLTRTDILTDLKLGFVSTIQHPKAVQTLQFTHTECQPPPAVTLTASNFIPVSTDASLFDSLWSEVGESEYSTLLADLGKNGVPLPIMEGFQFVFDQALLNLEQGYVGILADVEFTD